MSTHLDRHDIACEMTTEEIVGLMENVEHLISQLAFQSEALKAAEEKIAKFHGALLDGDRAYEVLQIDNYETTMAAKVKALEAERDSLRSQLEAATVERERAEKAFQEISYAFDEDKVKLREIRKVVEDLHCESSPGPLFSAGVAVSRALILKVIDRIAGDQQKPDKSGQPTPSEIRSEESAADGRIAELEARITGFEAINTRLAELLGCDEGFTKKLDVVRYALDENKRHEARIAELERELAEAKKENGYLKERLRREIEKSIDAARKEGPKSEK